MHAFRRPVLLGAVAAAVFGLAACSTDRFPDTRSPSALGAGPAATAQRLAAVDLSFAGTAAANDMYEVEAGRLAVAKAANAQVRSYGQMLVDHHTMSSNELLPLLRARGVAPPAALPADKQAKLAQLSRLSGAEFDRAFIRMAGVQDHQTAIQLFDQYSRNGTDRDLMGFATKTLPTLRSHLQTAQNIAGTLAG
jgi:putative membrane protein